MNQRLINGQQQCFRSAAGAATNIPWTVFTDPRSGRTRMMNMRQLMKSNELKGITSAVLRERREWKKRAPEWSEHRSERCVRNVWFCEACGYQFEHTVYFSAPKIQPDLRIEENERAA